MILDRLEDVDERAQTRRLLRSEAAPTVVLFHGLTATPRQYDELAPLLHERGCNVLVPRLPGHGYRDRLTDALASLEVAELIAAVKLALVEARTLGASVTVAGFSLGGLLAAYVAQREMVARAVCIAPFFGCWWWPQWFARNAPDWLGHVPQSLFLWWNPILRSHHSTDGYPRYPASAVRESLILAQAVFEDARENAPLTQSIGLVINPRESTCNNDLAYDLGELWRARGASVDAVELSGLGVSHDFMTPRKGRERARALAYPQILRAILG